MISGSAPLLRAIPTLRGDVKKFLLTGGWVTYIPGRTLLCVKRACGKPGSTHDVRGRLAGGGCEGRTFAASSPNPCGLNLLGRCPLKMLAKTEPSAKQCLAFGMGSLLRPCRRIHFAFGEPILWRTAPSFSNKQKP